MGNARELKQEEAPPPELAKIVYLGPKRAIYAYCDVHGQTPVLTFFESLPEDARGRYLRRFRTLGDRGYLDASDGHPLGTKQHKDCHGLWEIKDNASQSRIIYFADGAQGVLMLAHAFGGKKEDKLDETQIARAKRVRAEYVARRTAAPRRSAERRASLGRRR